jgi:hypothetical protein
MTLTHTEFVELINSPAFLVIIASITVVITLGIAVLIDWIRR